MLRRSFRRFCVSATPPTTSSGAASASAAAAAAGDTSNAEEIEQEKPLSAAELTPKKVAAILDSYIIGQAAAKRAVAVAMRNRWRRQEIKDAELRADVLPKNILMVGPTGVGKTEIARRMAKLTDAPFIKVEATKYTEVGFKGKDVESIIEDLYVASKHKARQRLEREKDIEATRMAQDTIWHAVTKTVAEHSEMSFETFLDLVHKKNRALGDVVVPVQTTVAPDPTAQGGAGGAGGMFGLPGVIFSGPGGEIFNVSAGGRGGAQRQTRYRPVFEAIELAKAESLTKLIDDSHVQTLAKKLCEDEGIVFLDEIDKVVADANAISTDASSLGVQQDLLPLVEGTNVTMKDGTQIATDSILFICSGAFHMVKPSDMIAELQGRLPVRVELKPLNEEEFRRILTEPKYNTLRQQKALLGTEGIDIDFDDSGVREMAHTATVINQSAQNIGARRLSTIIERVLEEISFDVDEYVGKKTIIDKAWVVRTTSSLKANVDLAKYLL